MAKCEEVKRLLMIATTIEEAEQIMFEHTAFETLGEKITFLKDMFGAEVNFKTDDSDEEFTYYAILKAIMTSR